MCDCISNGARSADQVGTPEVVLRIWDYFPDYHRETVCIDACIAPQIVQLWQAGVRTIGCCCGHNGDGFLGRPSVILASAGDAVVADRCLASDPRNWMVIFWAGNGRGQTDDT